MKNTRRHIDSPNTGLTSFVLQGLSISPGYARGQVHVHRDPMFSLEDGRGDSPFDAEAELGRLDRATASISKDLLTLAVRVEKEIDARLAEVFGAHNQILNDQLLKQELRQEIVDNLVTAGSAVKSVFLRWEKRFLLMESVISKEKGDDFRDISIRLRNALSGITTHPFENIPEGCVLVVQRLLPSDTIYLNNCSTAAVLLEQGTMGSHAALFARQMGIPCISDIPNIQNTLTSGVPVIVDAYEGTVSVKPNRKALAAFHRLTRLNNTEQANARAHAAEPSMTRDNVLIQVNANVGCREDSENAFASGADGIGLYRLEQFYIGRATPPSWEEVLNELRDTLTPFKGKPVCIRLLDVGSDKQLPFIGFMLESNPALGRRGIRLMRHYPELLRTQLQAILLLADEFDIRILIPMVTTAEDVKYVRDLLDEQCARAQRKAPKLGAMIETPAAALSAATFASYVDFMSFGTNDLTQYVFAADRENAEVGGYYNDASDAIFRLLDLVHDDLPHMNLSVCGELAGRKDFVLRVLQSGIRSLSVAPPLIPAIKETVRHVFIGTPASPDS